MGTRCSSDLYIARKICIYIYIMYILHIYIIIHRDFDKMHIYTCCVCMLILASSLKRLD